MDILISNVRGYLSGYVKWSDEPKYIHKNVGFESIIRWNMHVFKISRFHHLLTTSWEISCFKNVHYSWILTIIRSSQVCSLKCTKVLHLREFWPLHNQGHFPLEFESPWPLNLKSLVGGKVPRPSHSSLRGHLHHGPWSCPHVVGHFFMVLLHGNISMVRF